MKPLFLYAVSFTEKSGTERVVVLHANDEQDALYCICEGYGRVRNANVTLLDIQVGMMLSVHERKPEQ